MAKSADISTVFAQLSGLLLLGGFISVVTTGNSSFWTILIMIYFMLVVVNGIERGEKARKRK
jgi:hypothetical protein